MLSYQNRYVSFENAALSFEGVEVVLPLAWVVVAICSKFDRIRTAKLSMNGQSPNECPFYTLFLYPSIHYLSLTKSAFNPSDSQNIRQGQARFVVAGDFKIKENTSSVACSYQSGQ